MSFVTKNLGWILLLVFFLFMLFIISSNGQSEVKTNSGITTEIVEAKETQENLDSLIEMIDQEDISNISEEEIVGEENLALTSTGEVVEKKQSLFSRIFSRKQKDSSSENISEQSDVISGENNIMDTNVSGDFDAIRDSLIGKSANSNYSTDNIMKQTSGGEKKYYSQQELDLMYPGRNLETAVGKKFQIAVHSLKLNNANFNQTLGYMMKGDEVKQLTKENSHGCFQVEVLTTQKTGYVCKKYLKNSSETIENTSEGKAVTLEVPEEQKTKIGDFIQIAKTGVLLGNIQLSQGDIIDQMTEIDATGCFVAHVYRSDYLHNDSVGKVCVNNLY